MKILALEFSSTTRSVAIWADGQVRGRAEEVASRETHALAMIEAALGQAQLEREEIHCIAVGLGPGSYAGIRTAIALAQAWQLARGVNLLGVSSADCVAAQAQAAGWFGRMELILDAQRHGVGCATYEITADGWRETVPFRLLTTEGRASDGPLSLNRAPSPHPSPLGGERVPEKRLRGHEGGVSVPSDAPAHSSFRVRMETRGWHSAEERLVCPDAAMLARLAAGRSDFVSGESLAPIYLIETTFVKAPPPRHIP